MKSIAVVPLAVGAALLLSACTKHETTENTTTTEVSNDSAVVEDNTLDANTVPATDAGENAALDNGATEVVNAQ